jgi:hypothetical protein
MLSLDTTSLKNAVVNLNAAADKMHEQYGGTNDPKRLISERARYLVQNLGLSSF